MTGIIGAPFPNPLIPGFNPDPSVVAVGGAWYLVTSTFEYLPGIPVYRSTDFETWERIGNVATRAEQIAVDDVPTGLGVWAPTIRHHDGLFHVIVSVPAGVGTVVFTAEDPAGPWSDGTILHDADGAGLEGIDPDLAWGADGTVYVTYSGLILSGDDVGAHLGIQQVRVDLGSGLILEEPRSLWSGTGGGFPEAPHLYFREGDGRWYLLIAEGGTERGHGVSIARSDSPEGPFETAPSNPFLTARGTTRPVQNTGHGDLVEGPDGSTLLVLLGVRPRGATRAFSALGRETFVTRVSWVDGWPEAEPVALAPRGPLHDDVDFSAPLDAGWIGVRRLPSSISRVDGGRLTLPGEGRTLKHPQPTFVGRRQLTQTMRASVVVDVSGGAGGARSVGGLAVRYDEATFYAVEAEATDSGTTVTARAVIPSFEQEWTAELPSGPVTLVLESERDGGVGFGPGQMTSDFVVLRAEAGGVSRTLARLDGRYLSAETATSFTGRVLGLYATTGTPVFSDYRFAGTDE